MTSINTNAGALNARASALRATSNMERAMERLSSGVRVNSAADDAAGLAVAGKMESQLRGINMSIRNAQDGVGLIQTAESGLN
jgi:flagellin